MCVDDESGRLSSNWRVRSSVLWIRIHARICNWECIRFQSSAYSDDFLWLLFVASVPTALIVDELLVFDTKALRQQQQQQHKQTDWMK